MRMRLVVGVVGLVGLVGPIGPVGCWTSASKASQPAPIETASTGGHAYGGAAYGGAAYGGVQYGGVLSSLDATGQLGGFDDPDIYGGLTGNQVGDGAGGLGTTGTGGGGTGWGTIGTGRYGTIGSGTGSGSGGLGSGRGGMRGRTVAPPTVAIGQPSATGSLDKAIIRRYIKRNLQKIQYCYEKELVASPKLEGKVTVEFTIDGAGLVTRSTGSGLPVVDACVASVIRAIEFPKPVGGGVVTVRYPFTFQLSS